MTIKPHCVYVPLQFGRCFVDTQQDVPFFTPLDRHCEERSSLLPYGTYPNNEIASPQRFPQGLQTRNDVRFYVLIILMNVSPLSHVFQGVSEGSPA